MLRPFDAGKDRPALPEGWDDQLGFGYTETDAMYVARWTEQDGWKPGELYEHEGALLPISPGAAVLNYGQSVFEGMKAYRTKDGEIVLFRPYDNARRMRQSAARLCMPGYPVDAFVQAVETVVRANARWVPGYRKGGLYIRPVLLGDGPVLGVNPAPTYLFYIFCTPVGRYLGGDRVIVFDHLHRAAPYGTGAAKAAGNYAASMLGKRLAHELGYVDALFLDARENRYIEELGGANFFAVMDDGTLVTPQLGSILPGITRHSLITIAREVFGWLVVEKPLALDEVLERAVEVFYTGTAAILSSITTIRAYGKDHVIGDGRPGPKAQQLRDYLLKVQLREAPDPWGWVHPLPM